MPFTITPSAAAMSAGSILDTITATASIESTFYTMNSTFGSLNAEMIQNSEEYTKNYLQDQASGQKMQAWSSMAGGLLQAGAGAISFGIGYNGINESLTMLNTADEPATQAVRGTFVQDDGLTPPTDNSPAWTPCEAFEEQSTIGGVIDEEAFAPPATFTENEAFDPTVELEGVSTKTASATSSEEEQAVQKSDAEKEVIKTRATLIDEKFKNYSTFVTALGTLGGTAGTGLGNFLQARKVDEQAQDQGLSQMFQGMESIMGGIQQGANSSISGDEQAKTSASQLYQALIQASGVRG